MIDVLPDDLLLEIFDFYGKESTCRYAVKSTWDWTTLAHVCQRWQAIILASPRCLHLQVIRGLRMPVKTSLDIWPPFPLTIICSLFHSVDKKGEENLAVALEHQE
jgi:hypothetical protein